MYAHCGFGDTFGLSLAGWLKKNNKKKQLAGLSVKFYEIILSVFDNSNILRFKGLDELYYI